MRKLLPFGRGVLVLVGIVVLTSIGIDAADTLTNSNGTMLAELTSSLSAKSCPPGMVEVPGSAGTFCIDEYENSFTESCPYPIARSAEDAKVNQDATTCTTESHEGATVATFVSYHTAQSMCAKRSLRLPTALEWHEAAIGTPDTELCNTDGSKAQSGTFTRCRSHFGVSDAVGNVWEWVSGGVLDGVFEGVTLAAEGYVTEADVRGVATKSQAVSDSAFNADYVWSKPTGAYAVMRGGFYGSETDAGIFSLHAGLPASHSSEATGFRCAVTLPG